MLINFHGVELDIPDNVKHVCIDGNLYNVHKHNVILSFCNEPPTWVYSLQCWELPKCVESFCPFAILEVSDETKKKILSVTRPIDSMITLSSIK